MKYAKPPLSIDDQIGLLCSRGMVIDNKARAARYLTHINYYRLRAYWLPFEEPADIPNHKLKTNTAFNDVLNLYLFDRKFRLLVMEAIERVEISFRTRFAYELSLKYGSHAYLEPSCFSGKDFFYRNISTIESEIRRSTETFIEHYKTTYDDPKLPPIWAICEIMSFGQLSICYKQLRLRADRNAIARPFGIGEKALASFMHHLTHIRNITAHHGRLWNRRFVVTMTIPALPVELARKFNPGAPRNIYNTLVMLAYLLKLISPGTTWPGRMRALIEEYVANNTAPMGFPEDWRKLLLWK